MKLEIGLLLIILSGFFLVSSCSSTPNPKNDGRYQYQRPVIEVPQLAPESLYSQGMKAYQTKDFPKAVAYFKEAAKKWAGSPKQNECRWAILRAAVHSGDWQEVHDQSIVIEQFPVLTEAQAQEVYTSDIKSLENLEDVTGLIGVLNTASKDQRIKKQKDSFKIKMRELIESKIALKSLRDLAEKVENPEYKSLAYFRLGQASVDSHDLDEARRNFGRSLNADPKSDSGRRSQEYLDQLDSLRRVESKTIGLVLPMTEKYSSISQKTLRGVQMGLGLYGTNVSSFRLAVVDSEGNPDNARRGVERLVKEDGVIAIVDGVLSKTASSVASKANELGVPSIALSQKAGLTEVGPAVFRNSLTGEMQIRHLVRACMEDLGMKKFAVLYPNDAYGVEYANIFWDEVMARGGELTAVQSYSAKETDFRGVIQRLTGTFYQDDRAEEYRSRYKEWSDTVLKKNSRAEIPEDLLPPIVDFDGIFIPDGAKPLGQIAAMLSYVGVKGVKLLGTNLWNIDGLAKRSGLFSNSLIFVDSYVNSEAAYQNSSFVREYRSQFNEDPGPFELQAFDAGLLLRQLVSQGASSRETLSSELSRLRDFPGALGKVSMNDSREIVRPIVTLTVQGTQIVPLKRALTP